MTKEEDKVSIYARIELFLVSAGFGIVVGLIAKIGFDLTSMEAILCGFGYTVAHPIIGTFAVHISETLARTALVTEAWRRESRARAATVWSVVLVFWLVIFVPSAVINHMYRN